MAESLLSGADPWIALRVARARRQRGVAPVIRYPPPRPSPSTAEGAVLGHALALKMRLLVTRPEQDAPGSAGELAKLAGRRFAPGKRLLYLAGTDRARDLAGELASAGITVRTVEIYRAHPAEAFPTEVAAAFQSSEIDGVLHFSRRSAVI